LELEFPEGWKVATSRGLDAKTWKLANLQDLAGTLVCAGDYATYSFELDHRDSDAKTHPNAMKSDLGPWFMEGLNDHVAYRGLLANQLHTPRTIHRHALQVASRIPHVRADEERPRHALPPRDDCGIVEKDQAIEISPDTAEEKSLFEAILSFRVEVRPEWR